MIITHRAFCGAIRPIKRKYKILDGVYETRCLGVIVDSYLSKNSHLNLLERKLATLKDSNTYQQEKIHM